MRECHALQTYGSDAQPVVGEYVREREMNKLRDAKENTKPAEQPKTTDPPPSKTKVIHLGTKKHRMKNLVVLRDDEDHDLR